MVHALSQRAKKSYRTPGYRARVCHLLLAAGFALALLAAPARAWEIVQTEPAPTSGYAAGVAIPFELAGLVDQYEIHKYFIRSQQPLVLKFTREAGDRDTLQIVDELIMNMFVQEQLSWCDFHVLLTADPAKPVSFINPGAASAWQMTGGQQRLGGSPVLATATEVIWWTDQSAQMVPYSTFAQAPLNQLVLRGLSIDVSHLATGDTFYLKEWPTVPEPLTLATLGMGLVLTLLKRRSAGRS